MIFFGKKTIQKASDISDEADRINLDTNKKIAKAVGNTRDLKELLEANGITLRVYIATHGGKHRA